MGLITVGVVPLNAVPILGQVADAFEVAEGFGLLAEGGEAVAGSAEAAGEGAEVAGESVASGAAEAETENAAGAGEGNGLASGNFGNVVDNPNLDITGFSDHGLDQIISRGVSPGDLLGTVNNPSVVLMQSSGRYLFLSTRAGLVLSPSGLVITAYPASMFNGGVLNVMSQLGLTL
jgi:hypothetical protein